MKTYCNNVHTDQDIYSSVGGNTLAYFILSGVQTPFFFQLIQTKPSLENDMNRHCIYLLSNQTIKNIVYIYIKTIPCTDMLTHYKLTLNFPTDLSAPELSSSLALPRNSSNVLTQSSKGPYSASSSLSYIYRERK